MNAECKGTRRTRNPPIHTPLCPEACGGFHWSQADGVQALLDSRRFE
jgi:hypothetical protein